MSVDCESFKDCQDYHCSNCPNASAYNKELKESKRKSVQEILKEAKQKALNEWMDALDMLQLIESELRANGWLK
jgi:biotin synthase-like enzyme